MWVKNKIREKLFTFIFDNISQYPILTTPQIKKNFHNKNNGVKR